MSKPKSTVLYTIITRKQVKNNSLEFLLMPKVENELSFPATKFREDEDLYSALARIMNGDLKLPMGSFFPEVERPMLQTHGISRTYPGLAKDYYLYPVEVSLAENASLQLEKQRGIKWVQLDKIADFSTEPNIMAVCKQLQMLKSTYFEQPGMDAQANQWAKKHNGGIRKLSKGSINRILGAGNRAFNLRVADPYLAYQRQGLGFTWSFFTPKDKQDIHVHGQPAVEIYGVMEGEFVLWHKPMYERGALVWKKEILKAGDWIKVEALHCHFGYWKTKEGYGTVIKAAGTGELAGDGRIGTSGKTVCRECPVEKQCQKHPEILPVLSEYQKAFDERDWEIIKGEK